MKETEVIYDIVSRLHYFRGSFAITPSHIERPFPNIRFTFDGDDLSLALSNPNVCGAIHHGHFCSRSYPDATFLFEERVAALAPAALGSLSLTYDQLRRVLIGAIHRWDELGFESKQISVLAHGDALHLQALCSLMCVDRENIASSITLHDTYDTLAAAAASIDYCLVFGLRPSRVYGSLNFVHVNGIPIWDDANKTMIPGLPIHLILPSRALASTEVNVLRSYLEAVENRAAADAAYVARLSASANLINAREVA